MLLTLSFKSADCDIKGAVPTYFREHCVPKISMWLASRALASLKYVGIPYFCVMSNVIIKMQKGVSWIQYRHEILIVLEKNEMFIVREKVALVLLEKTWHFYFWRRRDIIIVGENVNILLFEKTWHFYCSRKCGISLFDKIWHFHCSKNESLNVVFTESDVIFCASFPQVSRSDWH